MALTNDLKQSILLAAISGRLTKQLKTDTPVDTYLADLEYEKEQYGGKRKARRGVNLSDISEDEIPCEIPQTWRYVRLINIVKSISAGGDKPKNFSKEKTEKNTIEVISNGETNKGIFGYTDKPVITETSLTISGRGTIGYSVIRTEPYVPIVRLLVVLPLSGTNLEYIKVVLTALIEFGSGTAVKQLTVPMISPKVIPLPPMEEQQRIVECVNMLMGKLDEFSVIEQQLITLKTNFPADMRGAILQAAMQGKLTEQLKSDSPIDSLIADIEEQRNALIKSKRYKKNAKLKPLEDADIPFDIPETWRWCKLGYCSTYGQSKEKASAQDLKSQLWSLDLEDIEKGSGRVLEKKKACDRQIAGDKVKFTEGNILYSKLRPYLLKVLIADEDGICTPELIPFDMIGNINPKFILCVLRSPHVDFAINAVTYGVKMPRVGTDTMINLMIPLPPVEEQQRIVERLDTLLPLCDTLME